MRDYAKVSSGFWTGKTGRMLRGNHIAQIVAIYLITSPHANMIGVFHCPIIYIAHETGCPFEGASEALRSLEEMGFCTFDGDEEVVWVHEMARFQIGDVLDPKDKRVRGIQKQFEELPEGRIKSGFFDKYSIAFHLVSAKPLRSPSEAPPKPGTGTGTGERTGTEEGAKAPTKAYAYQGSIVRLTQPDFDRWVRAYRNVTNLQAELESYDAWLTTQPTEKQKAWFHGAAGWLARKDAEYAGRRAVNKTTKNVVVGSSEWKQLENQGMV